MTSMPSRSLRKNRNTVELTLGDLVAAFYDEAQRVSKNDEEADRLAKASLTHVLRHARVRNRRNG